MPPYIRDLAVGKRWAPGGFADGLFSGERWGVPDDESAAHKVGPLLPKCVENLKKIQISFFTGNRKESRDHSPNFGPVRTRTAGRVVRPR